MRLELEIDYEPDEDEALEIRSCTTSMQRRTVVQKWLGFTGCIVQGVGVIEDGQEGPAGHRSTEG